MQKIIEFDTRTAPKEDMVYLFFGILICNSCGCCMTRKTNTYKGRKYFYYYCPTGKKHECDHPTMLKEEDLTDCVLKSLQAHIRNVVSLEELVFSLFDVLGRITELRTERKWTVYKHSAINNRDLVSKKLTAACRQIRASL